MAKRKEKRGKEGVEKEKDKITNKRYAQRFNNKNPTMMAAAPVSADAAPVVR